MVCFDITVAYPLQQRQKNNIVQEQKMEHIRKSFNADILGSFVKENIQYIRFAVCDEDAFGLLRDIPQPVYCVEISILRTKDLFYSFKKITGLKVIPPRDILLLKKVYWAASQLERRIYASV